MSEYILSWHIFHGIKWIKYVNSKAFSLSYMKLPVFSLLHNKKDYFTLFNKEAYIASILTALRWYVFVIFYECTEYSILFFASVAFCWQPANQQTFCNVLYLIFTEHEPAILFSFHTLFTSTYWFAVFQVKILYYMYLHRVYFNMSVSIVVSIAVFLVLGNHQNITAL